MPAMPAIFPPAPSRPARRPHHVAAVLLALLLLVPAALGPLPARAQGTPGGVLAPGNPPLTRQVTDAFAETMVFALQVVATGETWDLARPDEASFKDAVAQGLAAGYPGMAPEGQQALGQLPQLRTVLRQAWPLLPAADREALRDGLRPSVQAMLDELDCRSFVELAAADFVEGSPENLVRLLECWDEAVSPAAPPAAAAPATPATPATRAIPAPSAQPSQPNPVAQQAQQGLMSSHNTYIHMSNVLTQNHAANMNAILTMGGSPYRYEVKYR